MMMNFNPLLTLIIIVGVLQVCTADPISDEVEKDVTKLFTADELARARNSGLNDGLLIRWKSEGYTLDEMIQRTSICAYISEPFVHETDASSFGLQLIPYMKFRFWKLYNQNATGVERVTTAKQLCCIYNGRYMYEFKVPSVLLTSEEQMNEFAVNWNEFETAKTSKSFLKVCDLLRSTDTIDEC